MERIWRLRSRRDDELLSSISRGSSKNSSIPTRSEDFGSIAWLWGISVEATSPIVAGFSAEETWLSELSCRGCCNSYRAVLVVIGSSLLWTKAVEGSSISWMSRFWNEEGVASSFGCEIVSDVPSQLCQELAYIVAATLSRKSTWHDIS